MKTKLNEHDLQFAVYNYRHRIQPFPLVLTNIYLWRWECDVMYITKDGYPHEFEIKTTHSDFLADAKKQTKHRSLEMELGPASFYYVCPPDVINILEIPAYAGLAYTFEFDKYYIDDPDKPLSLEIIKKAPRLKSKSLTEKQWREIASKSADRYWSLKKHCMKQGENNENRKQK